MDTPVKRYSSGMYVRLALAVAAHLEPEILLVDEVLAAKGWCCKNAKGERRRTYGRFKGENCGKTRILTRV